MMGCDCLDCYLTEDERYNKNHSKQLDELIERNKRKQKTEIKLLLLGTGESGKSTFLRQMRIIYDNGFSDEEKQSYAKAIMKNILQAMQTMIGVMHLLNIGYERKSNVANARLIRDADNETFALEKDMYILAIKKLWNDAGIKECYMRRREYQLIDSIKYYVKHIDRIGAPGYLPSEEDILHVRVPTSGLVEYTFNIENYNFRMVDVGGQRSERMKWLHCFDNVKAILFLVAISEYDQVLMEADHLNRVIESRNVFQSISENEWFNETGIILFLNKIDLLEEKILYSDLVQFFPDFQGPKRNYLAAREFMANIFTEATERKRLYKHFTCATDTENIQIVFVAVKDTILNGHLNRFGLF